MNPNPFAPPTAHVADIVVPVESLTATPFFAVSLLKLATLSICSLGLYELFWFYRNWHLIRARDQSGIMPFWRALFAVFFAYSCFARMRDHGVSLGIAPPLAAGALAAAWIITTMTWKLPDPYWLISLLAVAFLLPVQAYVNRINSASVPNHNRNARFSAWNWVAVIVGGGLLVLALAGSLLPQQ